MIEQNSVENIYLTGDTHGNFRELLLKTRAIGLTSKDLLIILGDVGVNYDNGMRDINAKNSLCRIPSTILCVHGNHERRPTSLGIRWHYYSKEWMNGEVWYEKKYPRLLFAKDGCSYTINDRRFLVIGGAYSIDKMARLRWGHQWFNDEQPSEEIKDRCRRQIETDNYQEDIILSHTCPFSDRPKDKIRSHAVNQAEVDTSTEAFLQEIKGKVKYNKWFCGHWHIDRKTSDIEFLYRKVSFLGYKTQ